MTRRVDVVCRNWQDDRVLPRFARHLGGLGWRVTATHEDGACAYYLMGYFETQMLRSWPSVPVASLFTHREEQPPGNKKAALYDEVAARVDLRVAMCARYAAPLSEFGRTVPAPLPVEDAFRPVARPRRKRPVAGLSGYTYSNKRKGDDLAARAVREVKGVDWSATGRGWPVSCRKRSWAEMPAFYQALDFLVCPSLVEGGPMNVLEAMACGVPVVVPRGVGIIDELPDVDGVFRYERGNYKSMAGAVALAAARGADSDPEALRAAVARHSVGAWQRAHDEAFG